MVCTMVNTLAVGEREGSGDGYWLLEGKNGIGGGEGFVEANRESAARRN